MKKTVIYEEAAKEVLDLCVPGKHFCETFDTPSGRFIAIDSTDLQKFCITWSCGGEPTEYVLVDLEGLREYIEHWADVLLLYYHITACSGYGITLKKTAEIVGFKHPEKILGERVLSI